MAFDAIINGVHVYSDKNVKTIDNSRIKFTDGSSCDVATGTVINKGDGEIVIGGSVIGTARKTTVVGPERFAARRLKLSQLWADVSIQPYAGTVIEVTISGPEDEVKGVHTNIVLDDQLVISGDYQGTQSSGTVVSSGRVDVISRRGPRGRNSFIHRITDGVSSVLGGGAVSVSSVTTNPTKVNVKVPVGTPIHIEGGFGDTHIGDTDGPLVVELIGSGDVEAGRVSSAELYSRGSGDIDIEEVNGNVFVNLRGSGDVSIDRGRISFLTVTLQSSGDVEIGGDVGVADLALKGSGDIYVSHVHEKPKKVRTGSGDIEIGRVG